ncbi:MAG TPA: ATP-binding cassette domain-containing protein [Sphingomicrobium sp.]|nr:ATP-binding cassette domain-containing protein [Sphingomicrobium sp.]
MSVVLRDVTKDYRTRHGFNRILRDINFRVEPGERVGILGQNGAGKSTLIRVLSGSERPTSGTVSRSMSVSWPLAFGGAFLGALTGIDNVRFVCRLYGVDAEEKLPEIEDFAELGKYLREPVRSYSSGMRARLAFATSMAIDFDCYLIDEIIAVGDDRFQRKCEEELFVKRGDRALLIVSHSSTYIREHCHRASVLSSGILTNFPDVEQAFEYYASHELALQPHMSEAPQAPNEMIGAAVTAAIDEIGTQNSGLLHAKLRDLRLQEVSSVDAAGLVGNLHRGGLIAGAVAVSEFLMKERPDEPLFFVTSGDLFAMRRQHRPAVAAYLRALDVDPSNYWANRNLATEYFNVGRYPEAANYFEKARTIAPSPEQALEMQTMAVDSRFWMDEPAEPQSIQILEQHPIHVVNGSCLISEDGSSSRISVAGLARNQLNLEQLRCVVEAHGQRHELLPAWAPNPLRRMAIAAKVQAFEYLLYAPIPHEHGSLTCRFELAGLPVLEHRIDALSVSGPSKAGTSLLESARIADREHRSAACVLLYGQNQEEMRPLDVVRMAENLILLGLFHEAHKLLWDWFSQHWFDFTDEHADAILDMLCVEIARARLPGWRQEISALLSQARAKGESPSILANEGHLAVAEGQMTLAISHYAKASAQLGDRQLIHFARGIHTARFAGEVESPRSKSSAKINDEPEFDIVHLFACDSHYFCRYAESLVRSSSRNKGGVALAIHAHIVDPDEPSLQTAERLAEEYGIRFTTEQSPPEIRDSQVRRAYFTCARFLMAPQLLASYGCPILITETDALINWTWADIVEHAAGSGSDVGFVHSALWSWVPWTKIPAGIFFYAPTDPGHAWADYVARFIQHAFDRQGGDSSDVWTVDQVGLWLAQHSALPDCRTVHLPMASILTLATGDKANVLEGV